jgi:hypothetical protein
MKLRGGKESASYLVRKRIGTALYTPEPVSLPVWPNASPDALSAVARIRDESMIPDRGLVALYLQMAHLERVSVAGAVVECGVWHGGAAALMALANLDHGEARRKIHLFDSFCGIPQPVDGVDGTRAVREARGNAKPALGGPITVGYDYSAHGGPGSPDGVRALFADCGYPDDSVDLHVGWFQERVPERAPSIGPIAMLHLDGDWYESTKVCLEHLYQQVVTGGFVVIDDYGCYEGCRRAVDEFIDGLVEAPFLNWVNEEIVYLIKPVDG